MARFIKNDEKNRGTSNGTPVFVAKKRISKPIITLIDYNEKKLNEMKIKNMNEGSGYKKSGTVTWINIDGLHDMDLIKQVGAELGLHHLLMEDIASIGQRPKLEESDDYIFLVLKMIYFDEIKKRAISEQISLVLSKNFLITFQEKKGDVFDSVRERIRKGRGRIRSKGTDYLAYTLIDTIVDNYIFTIEKIGEEIEDLEEEIISRPNDKIAGKINIYKREMNHLRKSIMPAREAIMKLNLIDSKIVKKNTMPYLKDLEELITHVTEIIDSYRDMLSDQLSLYHASISHRMNEIMKVLTMFAAIFIPLTFIAGVYGTNFRYFPELYFRYSYFIFWGVNITIALILLRFFKRKGWF